MARWALRAMMLYMSNLGTTVVAAVLTALATTTVLEMTVKPWLEARSARIKQSAQARYGLAAQAQVILAACDRLAAADAVAAANTTTREVERDGRTVTETRFGAHQALDERRRWREQLDVATKALVDGYEAGGASITWSRHSGLLADYVITARWVCISELSEGMKLRHLRALTEPAQTLFFSNWPAWLRSATSPKALEQVRMELQAALHVVQQQNVLGVERPTIWDLMHGQQPTGSQ